MLPGLVRTSNIRHVHFSRNPKIIEFLHEYEYVKEFGEGVDRMYREMEAVGLPEPVYRPVEFMLHATIRNYKYVERQEGGSITPPVTTQVAAQVTTQVTTQVEESRWGDLIRFCQIPKSKKEMMEYLGLANASHFRKMYLVPLLESGKLRMTIPDKPNSRNQKYIRTS